MKIYQRYFFKDLGINMYIYKTIISNTFKFPGRQSPSDVKFIGTRAPVKIKN